MSWVQKKTAFKAAVVSTLGWAFLSFPLTNSDWDTHTKGIPIPKPQKRRPFMAFPGRESCCCTSQLKCMARMAKKRAEKHSDAIRIAEMLRATEQQN